MILNWSERLLWHVHQSKPPSKIYKKKGGGWSFKSLYYTWESYQINIFYLGFLNCWYVVVLTLFPIFKFVSTSYFSLSRFGLTSKILTGFHGIIYQSFLITMCSHFTVIVFAVSCFIDFFPDLLLLSFCFFGFILMLIFKLFELII